MSWDWDYEPRQPRAVKDGIKPKRARGQIGEKWWSQRWLKTLESFQIQSRLQRGRTYARSGQVMSLHVESGEVRAKVQGSMPKPYSVSIKLARLSDAAWEKVIGQMASQAAFSAKLLAGEMPHNIDEAFAAAKADLFPAKLSDLDAECTCPDYANPCKHIAAVYYILADQFDDDPFLLFTLRGRDKDEVLAELRKLRGGDGADGAVAADGSPDFEIAFEPAPPLEACLDAFWQAGEALAAVPYRPPTPTPKDAMLRRLGPPPDRIGGSALTDVLGKVYAAVNEAAQAKQS
jgi:uncharacterized Zn finger protein